MHPLEHRFRHLPSAPLVPSQTDRERRVQPQPYDPVIAKATRQSNHLSSSSSSGISRVIDDKGGTRGSQIGILLRTSSTINSTTSNSTTCSSQLLLYCLPNQSPIALNRCVPKKRRPDLVGGHQKPTRLLQLCRQVGLAAARNADQQNQEPF